MYPLDHEALHLWKHIVDWLLDLSIQVWEAVKIILTADAPEGYELERQDELDVSTKDLLSYCWRALKESRFAILSYPKGNSKLADIYSTLAHSMISSSKPTLISQAFQKGQYRKLGELAFQQLAELRHRGAFSAVSQTFAECCLRCAHSGEPEMQALPKEWYQVSHCQGNTPIGAHRYSESAAMHAATWLSPDKTVCRAPSHDYGYPDSIPKRRLLR